MTQPMVGNQAEAEDALQPYRLKERFLSAPEIALYRAIREMAKGHYVIFAKVGLNEIFSIVRPNENVHYFNKLFRRHLDFLLCEPKTVKPEIGVQLARPMPTGGRRSADQFMEDLFLTVGLPLVQVPADDHYDTGVLVTMFQQAIARTKQVERKLVDVGRDSIPLCPVCGKMMVLRTFRSGAEAGQLYYGCIDNPGCPGAIPLKE